MNILVVSDCFVQGGLETHINTFYNELKGKNKLFFAFGRYEKSDYLKDAKVYDDFNFSSGSSVSDFINDVEHLVEIIKDNRIDAIHVHPFYGLFPAIVAANITETKIAFTCHGRASLNYYTEANDTILYRFAIEEFLNAIFCVSVSGVSWLEPLSRERVHFFPNLIDISKYNKHEIKKNKRWALITRLDDDKLEEIIKLLDMLDNLDIKALDIYGSGNKEDFLKEYIKDKALDNLVTLKGYISDLNNVLDGKYCGVIGQGRVALEGLAMNYPTMLIGYGKVVGLITKDLYNVVKNLNFVPTGLEDISAKELNKQLKLLETSNEYQMRAAVINDFSSSKYKEQIKLLNKIKFSKVNALTCFYDDLKSLDNKQQPFFVSSEVFYLLLKYIVPYCSDLELKNLANLYCKVYGMNQQIYDISLDLASKNNDFDNNINALYNKIKDLDHKIEAVSSIMNQKDSKINELLTDLDSKVKEQNVLHKSNR